MAGNNGTNGTGQFGTLLEINQALTTSGKLRSGLERVLEILNRSEELARAAVVVADPMSGQLRTEAAIGAAATGTLPLVERVIESGRPMVVPHTSKEPLISRAGRGG